MADNNKELPHLWISDEEVVRIKNKPQGRDKPRDVIPSEHGSKLSAGLQNISDFYQSTVKENSLIDEDLMIFKVVLPESEKIDNSQRQKLLQDEGLTINAVKNGQNVIVSTNKEKFYRLGMRVDNYKKNGRYAGFQYIESFEPYSVGDKQSGNLKRSIYSENPPENIDIQILLMPKLKDITYKNVLVKLSKKIKNISQSIEEPYYLTDGTPVIRAIVPSAALQGISEDQAIYRVEETRFYSPLSISSMETSDASFLLNKEIDINSLPVVAILDNGIKFQGHLNNLILNHWMPSGCKGGNCEHGTQVASKAIFRDILRQLSNGALSPRVRVIDCNIMDGRLAENVFIDRIQQAVINYKDITKIFNLSANAENYPIDGDEISILGYELDNLMNKYYVEFVISTGNHEVWKASDTLEEILDDDDTRISPPADAMLGITVGSIVGQDHVGSLSHKNMIAPYSRKGPGFAGFRKPNIVAYGATIIKNPNIIPPDPHSALIDKNGRLSFNAGTSFAAPIVTGDLAEISHRLPSNNIMLGKALLYHAAIPLIDDEGIGDEDAEYYGNIYGYGLSTPELSMFSNSHRVTFIRTGELNRETKEHVKFHMPSVFATISKRNIAKVTVTCVSKPPIDKTRGAQYLSAYIKASLHKAGNDGEMPCANPTLKEGKKKWDTCYHFEKTFSKLVSGDWEIWLELFTRWEVSNSSNIPYALAVTIEDLSESLDIYQAIQIETEGRFIPINQVRIPVLN